MPSNDATPVGDQYSPLTGLIYVFNLIVGTGSLTLPAAFASTGWLLSSVGILLLALASYFTATWVVETMACANAINHWIHVKQLKKRGQVPDGLVNGTLENAEVDHQRSTADEDAEEQDEDTMLIPGRANDFRVRRMPVRIEFGRNSRKKETIERTVGEYYSIQQRLEMGQMAKLFFTKGWVKLFYIVLCVYLYGDLAIYQAAVAKTLRDVTCTYVGDDCSAELLDSDPCFVTTPWLDYSLSRLDVYKIYTVAFVCVMGPFVFLNLSKTKYMQIATTITRWMAMISMITWAVVIIAEGQKKGNPPVAKFRELPELFGVCVYAFMCHHSLPSLITPISNKNSLFKLLAADYLLILLFYYLLAFTGIFAFSHLYDLYTLNFQPDPCEGTPKLSALYVIQMFLLLFPVFTLSTNFPIIAITLRNNLKALFLRDTRRYSFFTYHCLFPLLAIIPSTVVGLITSNVEFLVNITGAYAGSIIQYVVPATLVYYARKTTLKKIGMGVKNPFTAPLQHKFFLYFICAWAVVCQVFVTLYLFSPDQS